MVKAKNNLFQCNECKLFYKDREIAEKCEAWCSKHKSCNIEIIQHAVSG
ncbi:MAG: hypothetical protein HY392_01010 [Candidatus Diapherotrites archaeon]|nr:hypothetical protein [Candidatus Diapherotrites archaeon]